MELLHQHQALETISQAKTSANFYIPRELESDSHTHLTRFDASWYRKNYSKFYKFI